MFGGGGHTKGLHMAGHLSFGQEGGCHIDPQIDEEISGTTTSIGRLRIRHEASRTRQADKCHDAGQLGTNRRCGGGLGILVNVEGTKDGRDGRCQGDMLLRPCTLPQLQERHAYLPVYVLENNEYDGCKDTACRAPNLGFCGGASCGG